MSRLIDADALHKYMFKSASERMSLSVEYMGGWNDAINYIASQTPTVEAISIEYIQHWIDKKNYGRRNGKMMLAKALNELIAEWRKEHETD